MQSLTARVLPQLEAHAKPERGRFLCRFLASSSTTPSQQQQQQPQRGFGTKPGSRRGWAKPAEDEEGEEGGPEDGVRLRGHDWYTVPLHVRAANSEGRHRQWLALLQALYKLHAPKRRRRSEHDSRRSGTKSRGEEEGEGEGEGVEEVDAGVRVGPTVIVNSVRAHSSLFNGNSNAPAPHSSPSSFSSSFASPSASNPAARQPQTHAAETNGFNGANGHTNAAAMGLGGHVGHPELGDVTAASRRPAAKALGASPDKAVAGKGVTSPSASSSREAVFSSVRRLTAASPRSPAPARRSSDALNAIRSSASEAAQLIRSAPSAAEEAPRDPADSDLWREFERSLVVHKGKEGLEAHRPNPYSGDLPRSMKAALAEFAHSAETEAGEGRAAVPAWGREIASEALNRTDEEFWEEFDEEAESRYQKLRWHPQFGTKLFRRQWELEQRGVEIGRALYQRSTVGAQQRGTGAALSPAKRLLEQCFESVKAEIENLQRTFVASYLPEAALMESRSPHSGVGLYHTDHGEMSRTPSELRACGPVLISVPADKLAVLTLHTVISAVLARGGRYGIFGQMALDVGRAAKAELQLSHAAKYIEQFRLSPSQLSRTLKRRNARQLIKLLEKAAGEFGDDKRVLIQVGAVLLDVVLRRGVVFSAQEQREVAAFEHFFMWKKVINRLQGGETGPEGGANHKSFGCVAMHPVLLRDLSRSHWHLALVAARALPMVVVPRPWSGFADGSYLKLNATVMRTVGSGGWGGAGAAGDRQREWAESGDLSKVLRALNVLGSTRWTINTKVLQVVQLAWTKDFVISELPSKYDIEEPSPEQDLADIDAEGAGLAARMAFFEKLRVKQKNMDLHSLRCSLINQLHVAMEMSKYEAFYFPHNLDFRGRAYPIPPHLNHLGSDICRGLLKFAEKKPLGGRGLFWLKVHLANLFGNNKINFAQRAAWSEERRGQIALTARDPLSEEALKWWQSADDPWQALATCMEIAEAEASGDPASFLSNLAVHQDGSCNGLQHYAALGLDHFGGEQVNLVPGEKPSDPYTTVCRQVVENIKKDIADPDFDEHKREIAQLVVDKVDRKVVKQTVMTTVYGVTYIGARDQIANRLREKYGEGGSDELTAREIREASGYIASVTLKSVGDIFKGAKTIMQWLTAAAQQVAKTGRPVRWETPLGLRVVQPYTKDMSCVKTVVQEVALNNEGGRIHRQRQRTAFPPNFVHSLDSTHLLMTALEFDRRGGTFAGVHDSYWTHAADFEELAFVLRDEFVKLYSLDIMGDLKASLERDFPDAGPLPPLPHKGSLNIDVVRDSPYFFS